MHTTVLKHTTTIESNHNKWMLVRTSTQYYIILHYISGPTR
jgi:hypothetical protein